MDKLYRKNFFKFLGIALIAVIGFSFVSCDDGGGSGGGGNSSSGGGDNSGGGGGGGGGTPTVPQTRTFYAQRGGTVEFYQLQAELLAQNTRCEIWVEKGSGVTAAQAQTIASRYSDAIYPKMISAFSENINASAIRPGLVFNIMDYAHWFVTGETTGGKLTILLLDIKDEYVQESNDAFVAGYFTVLDFFENDPPDYPSNERVMLYIDTYPSLSQGLEFLYRTIAHEMQHLMNFAVTLLQRIKVDNGEVTAIYLMDTWINEGLSSAAEWVYLGRHLEDRIQDFNEDYTGLIAKGNNFFVWDNRDGEDQNAVLDDYATVYLFFQWLRLQTGGNTAIYKNIIWSEKYDFEAITKAFNDRANESYNWHTMLQTWLRANYSRSSSNDRYGYRNDTVLNGIKVHYAPAGGNSINLYPGEGVYSYVDTSLSVPSSSGGNIRYINAVDPDNNEIASGGALLTYNISTTVIYNNGILTTTPESGTITGAHPNANITAGRSVLDGVRSGPFPISAADMLKRRGRNYVYERNFTGVNNRLLNQRLLTGAVIE